MLSKRHIAVFGALAGALVAGVFLTPQNRVGPADLYPPVGIVGVTNPDITQETIGQTICNPQWTTGSIRPGSGYTTSLKKLQLEKYAYDNNDPTLYEEDHFISLILGGHPTSPLNLWPQAWVASVADGGARSKDRLENYLHRQVCAGAITLSDAQTMITSDWYAAYKDMLKKAGYGEIFNEGDHDDE